MDTDKQCVWREDEDGNWDTRCGEKFILMEGTPKDNRMNYCPYCGGELSEVSFSYPKDDDE